MTSEITAKLNALHNKYASQGQTGEFIRRATTLLQSQTEILSAEEIQEAIRAQARRVCDDEDHVTRCLAQKL